MKKTDIRIGNLICYDFKEHRDPPVPLMRGIVTEIHQDGVVFDNGEKRPYDKLAGLVLDEKILLLKGFEKSLITEGVFHLGFLTITSVDGSFVLQSNEFDVELNFVHELQNLFFCLTGSEINEMKQ